MVLASQLINPAIAAAIMKSVHASVLLLQMLHEQSILLPTGSKP